MVPRSWLGAAKDGTRPNLILATAFAYKHRNTAPKATTMPVANYKTYCKMLDRARAGRFAFPAINVTSLTTANAVLRGLADSKSDGIIQVSTGGGTFVGLVAKGHGARRDRDRRARSSRRRALSDLRRAAHRPLLARTSSTEFVLPLVEETERRRAAGQPNLFTGHMFDGSNLELQENLEISAKLLERFTKNDLVLEIETGAVGGEEDDVVGDKSAKLYTTPEDTLEVARRLNPIGGRYLLAATFGNVHGVYKPGHVKLKPGVLKECQDAVVKAHGEGARFYLVFHGGSGFGAQRDSRSARLRRGKDERGHRHAVCVHPCCRWPYV